MRKSVTPAIIAIWRTLRESGASLRSISQNTGYSLTSVRNYLGHGGTSVLLAFGESKSIRDWSTDIRCLVSYGTLFSRLNKKWPLEKALITPVELYKTSCPYGHPYDEANTKITNLKNGKRQRACKTCVRERSKWYHLKDIYAITKCEWLALLDAQGGLCASCQEQPPTDLDHSHETGKIRGLLCNPCNLGLGIFKDDLDRLRKAVAYLERYTDG